MSKDEEEDFRLNEDEIAKIVEKVKGNNGNDKIKTKDLLWYAIGKMDNLEKKLDDYQSKTNDELKTKLDKRVFFAILGGLVSLLGIAVKWLL